MARHAQAPQPGRAASGGGDDGTASGIVLPLVAAAVVCLLATTGVLLFGGSGDDTRGPDPVGLNVPSAGRTTGPTGPDATGPAATASATAVPTRSAVSSSAPPTSRRPSASASATTQPAGETSRPAPPPPAPDPREVTARVTDRWGGGGHVEIRNPSDRQTYSWELVLKVGGGKLKITGDVAVRQSGGGTYTVTGRAPLAPGGAVSWWYQIDKDAEVRNCTLNGGPCRLDL